MRNIKNLLWPTAENGYRPPVLKTASVVTLATLFLLWNFITRIVLDARPLQANDLTTGNIMAAINRERSLRNLLTLNANDKLAYAAQWKADDMIARNYFAHVDPDGNYIWPKITAAGYTPYLQLGENLAVDFYDTDSLVAAWMNSPTHRANVLNEGFKDQGMGLSFGSISAGQYYSSIANTFGALLISKAPAALPPSKPAAPSTPPPAQTAPPNTTPSPPPVAGGGTSAPASSTAPVVVVVPPPATSTPIAVRGSGTPVSTAQNNGSGATAATASSAPASSAPAVVGSQPRAPQSANLYKANHYVVLGFGVAFLFLMTSDLRIILERQAKLFDKRLNNIFVLILALIIVGLIYWL